MKFKFAHYAGENEIFTKDTFKNSIGKPFKLKFDTSQQTTQEGFLLAAKVSNDGKVVEFTVDAPEFKIKMPDGYPDPSLFKEFETES